MTGLEKCCITSAYLQWLFHSGVRAIAHSLLFLKSCQKLLDRFQCNEQNSSFGDPLATLFKQLWLVKKHGGQWWGLFSLYKSIYIENFKNLLMRNHWIGFSITWQKCFFRDQLYQDCSSHHDSSENMATRGGTYFPLISIENFKNLLVRQHWTDFSIIIRNVSLLTR